MQQDLFQQDFSEEREVVIDDYAPAESTEYDASTFPPPRPFQDAAHNALRQGVKEGHRCQLIMAPTGAGKTYLGMRIIHEALKKGKRAVFLCDRKTLINQSSEVADAYGLGKHSVFQAGHWRFNRRLPFQIASVQTIARRQWPDADVIVIDEAHTTYKAWTEHIKGCSANVIALSATPFTKGLGKLFTNLINAATMHDLTESGVLVPMRVFSCKKVNMKGAATKGGEWTDKAAEERGMAIVGDVVTERAKICPGEKTIAFGATIAHCEEMWAQFEAAGVKAGVFCATTTDDERAAMLERFDDPNDLEVLISVSALAKGFDKPYVTCICDVRPLRKSLSEVIQMWGRGARSCQATGKKEFKLLDFSGNISRFADDFSEVFYNGLDKLNDGEKLDKKIRRDEDVEKKERKCPKCGYSPMGKICIGCGYQRENRNTVEHEAGGSMSEVFLGKTKLADDRRHLYEQICSYTRNNGKPETAKQRAYYLYREMTGGLNPSSKWDFYNIGDVPITRAVQGQIMRNRLAFAKGKQKAESKKQPGLL